MTVGWVKESFGDEHPARRIGQNVFYQAHAGSRPKRLRASLLGDRPPDDRPLTAINPVYNGDHLIVIPT